MVARPYLIRTQKTCSYECGRKLSSEKLTGRHPKGHPAWNKGISVRLSPKSEFKKGSIPWNKNVKGLHHSPETEFKKGIIPINKMKIGSIIIRSGWHKSRQPRRYIKIKDDGNVTDWEYYARYVFKQYEPLRKGYVVWHIDGRSLNDNIENLEQISRAEALYRNRWG